MFLDMNSLEDLRQRLERDGNSVTLNEMINAIVSYPEDFNGASSESLPYWFIQKLGLNSRLANKPDGDDDEVKGNVARSKICRSHLRLRPVSGNAAKAFCRSR